jgi:hypothetical protein
MMALKVTEFAFSPEQRERLGKLVPETGWSILSSTELSGILPDRYLAKLDSVIGVSCPTSSGGTCLMFNSLRVDTGTRLVDQDPLGVFVSSSGVSSRGVLIHHGDWDDRSWEASSRLWDDVEESGVGRYYQSNPPEGRHSGALAELPKGTSGALDSVLQALRARKTTSS